MEHTQRRYRHDGIKHRCNISTVKIKTHWNVARYNIYTVLYRGGGI